MAPGSQSAPPRAGSKRRGYAHLLEDNVDPHSEA